MSDAFSTSATHAFEHPELEDALTCAAGPSANGNAYRNATIEDAFEVEDTVRLILKGGYKTVALQFPDEMLPSSVQVFKAIQKRIHLSGAQVYVLADSTYGSCCPDVLSCLHLPADLLVHYGHACLTPTDALPVHYVFPRKKLDVRGAVDDLWHSSQEDFREAGSTGVMVIWDVAYNWLADDIVVAVNGRLPHAIAASYALRLRHSFPETMKGKEKSNPLRSIQPPVGLRIEDCVIWYIGEEGRSLLNIQMTHAANPLYLYSTGSSSTTALHPKTSRLLSKRLFALHSAMSSDVFGLIVGNVGLASSKPLLDRLRVELRRAKKKSYTLSVGRLNPAKLANFETIECFVLVGCAEGGVVDSKDFYRPIITPWELLLALEGPGGDWNPSEWTLDLAQVLERSHRHTQGADSLSESDNDSDAAPEFSLVTGTYRTRKIFKHRSDSPRALENDVNALTLRNNDFALAKLESAGSVYLNSREFKGLEARYGMDEPAILEEGRRGVAKGYTEEL